jgi:hypothetical protein
MSYGSDPSALDDYLNLDLFGSSRAAPQSPASSHGALPITPGTSADNQADEAMAFDGFNPLDKMAPFDMGLLGTDLGMEQYGSLFQDMFTSFSEPASGPSAPVINPQLFAASPPAPSLPPVLPAPEPAAAAAPEPTSTPGIPSIITDDEDEDDEILPLPRARKPKKNAAAAGGISKRPSRASTPASVVPSYVHFEDPKPVIPPALGKGGVASYLNGERIGSQEPDEWRPTPEEYKKLSSKEKRQLRNKISARNFRVRRKGKPHTLFLLFIGTFIHGLRVEYITTLESHIADRDQLISAIRSELSNTHNENNELRREIDALKVRSNALFEHLPLLTVSPPYFKFISVSHAMSALGLAACHSGRASLGSRHWPSSTPTSYSRAERDAPDSYDHNECPSSGRTHTRQYAQGREL